MAEQIPSTLGASVVLAGGYTAGSGLLNVVSTAGAPLFPTLADFRVVIQNQTSNGVIAVLKVTAINSATQFAVAPDPVAIDANAAAGDNVYCVLTEDALRILLAAAGGLKVAVVSLTAADIASLNTKFPLVPTPGPGQYILLLTGSVAFTAGGTPFTTFSVSPSTLFFCLGLDDLGVLQSTSINDPSFTGASFFAQSGNFGISPSPLAGFVDRPLTLGFVVPQGRIVTSVLNFGGSNYQAGDTGFVADTTGTQAGYTVDTVDGGGAVLTYHLTSAGSGYNVSAGISTTPESGLRTITINAPGLGYAAGSVISVDGGLGNALLTVDTVGGLGEVTSVTLTNPGSQYAAAVGATTQDQTGVGLGLTLDTTVLGVGFLIDITEIQTLAGGDGTMKVTVAYTIGAV